VLQGFTKRQHFGIIRLIQPLTFSLGENMKRILIALAFLFVMIAPTVVFSESGPCDCECLREAMLDPDTAPADALILKQTMEDYNC